MDPRPDAARVQHDGHPNMEVKRLPPEEEPGAPAAYGGAGSIDGSIPGKFWINLRTTEPAQQVQPRRPDVSRGDPRPHLAGGIHPPAAADPAAAAFNAYSEGWGLYAEQLADELGAYDDFPVGRLGYLQSMAFRACRLVVDTGLHAKRWTREQGVHYFVDVNGSNPRKWRARSIATAAGRGRHAATRSDTARSTGSATGRQRRSARSTTSRRSTTPSCSAATCRSTCWRRTSTSNVRTAGPHS